MGSTVATTRHKLDKLTGIGRASARALQSVGVDSIGALAHSDPVDLAAQLDDLHRTGGSKTNWASQAEDWVTTAQTQATAPPTSTEEISSFTVRFETATKDIDETGIHSHWCIVYDEQGAGEERSFDIDPKRWASFILERSMLPADVVSGVLADSSEEDAADEGAVEVRRVADAKGEAGWSLRARIERSVESETVFLVVADDGSRAFVGHAGGGDERGGPGVMLPALDPGDYRTFAWIPEQQGGSPRTPVQGPLIRISEGASP